MHHGFFASLEEVVRFYSTLEGALPPHPNEKLVDPLDLDEREQADVVLFLASLSDLELPEEWIGPPRGGL
jgi:cytochrome c peroxidase